MVTTLVHLDTDFAGDPDDACALAFLLSFPEVAITAITTNLDTDGRRAALVGWFLKLANREGIPILPGANASRTDGAQYESTWNDRRHWPEVVGPLAATDQATDVMLCRSIDQGATIVAIGGFTNLAALEERHPGALARAKIVAMAGWLPPPPHGYPQWSPEMDFSVQCDPRSAQIAAETAGDLTLVPLPVAMKAQLRETELPRLRSSGAVGGLLAQQSAAHAADNGMPTLGSTHAALPDDLVNFHWDPVTCAIALGWLGARVEERALATELTGGLLTFVERAGARRTKVAVDIDGAAFGAYWLSRIAALA